MNKDQAIALCRALGLDPFAPVGKVERWQAVIDATKPADQPQPAN